MSRFGLSACALGTSLVVAVVGTPATAASYEGSLFDGKKDASAHVYDRNERALERFWGDVDEIPWALVSATSPRTTTTSRR